jgi:hypothetical protein
MLGWIYPLSQQIAATTAIQTPFLTGKMRLFASAIAFTPLLTEAELVAIEATFTGYAAVVYTTLPAPYPDGVNGGASFLIPSTTFAVGATPTVGNDIYGGWVENAAGALLWAWQTQNPFSLNVALQQLNVEVVLNFFGNGNAYVQYNGVPQ